MAKTILLPLLADGEFRSGQDLADALGVSRTAVWKQLKKLGELGLQIESVKGRGYRIPGGIELLDDAAIRSALQPEATGLLSSLEILETVGSTNAEAMRRAEQVRRHRPGVHRGATDRGARAQGAAVGKPFAATSTCRWFGSFIRGPRRWRG